MKTLILIRHAESLEKTIFQNDFERKLSQKGRKDAVIMGDYLKKEHIKPDLILTSTAIRTQETATILAKQLAYPSKEIQLKDNLYNGSVSDLKNTIKLSDTYAEKNTLFLIAHNPGISQLAFTLAPDLITDYLPPCGMVGIKLNISSWSAFPTANNDFLFLKFPKNNK